MVVVGENKMLKIREVLSDKISGTFFVQTFYAWQCFYPEDILTDGWGRFI